jgi:hypothetical protein
LMHSLIDLHGIESLPLFNMRSDRIHSGKLDAIGGK